MKHNYSKYYDGIYILFHKDIRISELMGLTESEIDFDNGRLRITRQIHRKNNKEYYIADGVSGFFAVS